MGSGIDCYFVVFIYYFCKCRPFAEVVCGVRLTAVQMPITRESHGAPLQPIGTNFGLPVRLVDIINCAKFYRNRLRGLDSISGQSLTIPIGLRYRR